MPDGDKLIAALVYSMILSDVKALRNRCGKGVPARNQRDGYAMHGESCVYCRAATTLERVLAVRVAAAPLMGAIVEKADNDMQWDALYFALKGL